MERGAGFGMATTRQASGNGSMSLREGTLAGPLPHNAYDRLGGSNNKNATAHCRFL